MNSTEERIQKLEQELAILRGNVIKPKVMSYTNTCYACPSQWEGEMEDGKSLYIRYRWGNLSVSVGGETIYSERVGDSMSGLMSDRDMAEQTKHILDWSENSWLMWKNE